MEAIRIDRSQIKDPHYNARIKASFVTFKGKIELIQFEYFCPINKAIRISIRGRQSLKDNSSGNFQWTSAVIALCCTLIKAKLDDLIDPHERHGRGSGINSDDSKLALSLDYALTKNPIWLMDMFGVDQNGTCLSRRLLLRINSEKKRPGPVVINLNNSFISPKNIGIYLDDKEIIERFEFIKLIEGILPKSTHDHHNLIFKPPERQLSVKKKLESIAGLVYDQMYSAYLDDDCREQWSCSDAVLGLIRNTLYRDQIKLEARDLINFLKPMNDGSYSGPETSVGVPIVTATCVMALHEIRLLEGLSDDLVDRANHYIEKSLFRLLNSQSEEGWWTIVSEPLCILIESKNSRVWDTAYVLLSLSHIGRKVRLPVELNDAAIKARNWLISQYKSGKEGGWSNRPRSSSEINKALTSFVHFVMLYCEGNLSNVPKWDIGDVLKHLVSLFGHFKWNVALDTADYRLVSDKEFRLPHPNHIVQLGFIFALLPYLKSLSSKGAMIIEKFLDLNWDILMKDVYLTSAIFPYSQLLQGIYLFVENDKDESESY